MFMQTPPTTMFPGAQPIAPNTMWPMIQPAPFMFPSYQSMPGNPFGQPSPAIPAISSLSMGLAANGLNGAVATASPLKSLNPGQPSLLPAMGVAPSLIPLGGLGTKPLNTPQNQAESAKREKKSMKMEGNRLAAQRARRKKKQYVESLELRVKELEAELEGFRMGARCCNCNCGCNSGANMSTSAASVSSMAHSNADTASDVSSVP